MKILKCDVAFFGIVIVSLCDGDKTKSFSVRISG